LNFFNQAALKIKVLTAGIYLWDVEHPYPYEAFKNFIKNFLSKIFPLFLTAKIPRQQIALLFQPLLFSDVLFKFCLSLFDFRLSF
jgi:ABC-type uncharacterized transport system permease subunit